MICIDRFPGVERFIGLGQLTVDQLASLVGTRRAVTADEYALAAEAWRAFRASDPTRLHALAVRLTAASLQTPTPALPFLGTAVIRFFGEYPSSANGLSRTEELALQRVSIEPTTAGALFGETQALEARPFLGDSSFFQALDAMAYARTPLITVAPGGGSQVLRDHRVGITGAGRDVLAGRRDAVVLNGIDRWRGGVHLEGRDRSPWRWDAGREVLVS